MKLWQRYFLSEMLKVAGLFMATFYFLYTVIDYSVHASLFSQLSTKTIALYYLAQFSHRAEMLLPFALLIGTIKVLITLNLHNEITALRAGGLPVKRAMVPFLIVGLLGSAALYSNYQFAYPHAVAHIHSFQDQHFRDVASDQQRVVNAAYLADNTKVVYQRYDKPSGTFHDLYWLVSNSEIWHMKRLDLVDNTPLGHHVDHLVKVDGHFDLHQQFATHQFDQMALDVSTLVPAEELSITSLAHRSSHHDDKFNDREAEILTHFYGKLIYPLICLLVVLIPAPFCLHFTRHLPVFLIYSLAICGFLSFLTMLDATVILGENHVASPILIMLVPTLGAFIVAGTRFARLR